MSPRRLYLHVGTRKSGTSALQSALKSSRSALLEQGVNLPFTSRPHHVTRVLGPLLALGAGDLETGREGVRQLVRSLRNAPGDRMLVTLEDLAELPDEPAAHLLEALAEDFEVHVVITARDWSQQIPSEWQQQVKSRLTLPYSDYVSAVRGHRPEVEIFWRRQYLPDIARRWSQGLTPGRLHVMAVPSPTRGPSGIYRFFGDLVGFDIGALTIVKERSNISLGYEQVETLRRVNVALGDRLADVRAEYRAVVRPLLINGALRRQETGRRLLLPAEHVAWAEAQSRAMVEELREAGHDLLGDPEDLLPSRNDPGGERDADLDVEADTIARVAVQALADVMVGSHERAAAGTTARARKVAATVRPAATPTPPAARSRGSLVRRVARGIKGLVTP